MFFTCLDIGTERLARGLYSRTACHSERTSVERVGQEDLIQVIYRMNKSAGRDYISNSQQRGAVLMYSRRMSSGLSSSPEKLSKSRRPAGRLRC